MSFQELQESEVVQDQMAHHVKQLKAELVLFKGLVSNVSPFSHPPRFVTVSLEFPLVF